MLRRRRPLLRGAIIGGGAYMIGKNAARNQQREEEQEDRLNELETSEQGVKGGSSTSDVAGQIKELMDLKNAGVLSEAEFAEAKKKLLE